MQEKFVAVLRRESYIFQLLRTFNVDARLYGSGAAVPQAMQSRSFLQCYYSYYCYYCYDDDDADDDFYLLGLIRIIGIMRVTIMRIRTMRSMIRVRPIRTRRIHYG